jgi:hypothetical protein
MRSLFHTALAVCGCIAFILIYKSTQTLPIKLLLGLAVLASIMLLDRVFPKRAVAYLRDEG